MSTSSDNATATTTILDVDGIRHVYGQGDTADVAIDDLSFSISAGELVSIVGPSGAGKTTLLRILAGLLMPTSGTVSLLGKRVTSVPEGMAMVSQDYSRSLLPWQRVERNVLFPLTKAAGTREERHEIATEALRAVGLDGHQNKYPWQLSGGMQQRVAIARALAMRPQLLLMDEPFASVDAQTRFDLEDLTMRVRRELGITVVLVTHDIDEAIYLSDRIVVLSKNPSIVREVVDVPLGEQRSQVATRSSDAFLELRSHLLSLVMPKDV